MVPNRGMPYCEYTLEFNKPHHARNVLFLDLRGLLRLTCFHHRRTSFLHYEKGTFFFFKKDGDLNPYVLVVAPLEIAIVRHDGKMQELVSCSF